MARNIKSWQFQKNYVKLSKKFKNAKLSWLFRERGDFRILFAVGRQLFDRQLAKGQLSSVSSNKLIIDSKVGKHVSQLKTGLQELSERDFDGLIKYGYELLRLKQQLFP